MFAVQIADVGHACTTFEQHVQWSQRLQNEFFAQGDKERQDDLEISPLMNRQKPGVMDPKNQTTFDDVIVVPMLEAWSQIGPTGGQTLMNQTLMNKKAWEGIAEQRERVEESPGTV